MKNDLTELYSTHKGKVSDKWSLYLKEYDRLFDSFREKKISLLEIGVQNGGSLEIWSKYFQKHIVLVGCDINKDCEKLRYENDRIKVIVGDANSLETKEKVLFVRDNYDIIIDDGSHTSGDIIKAFANYFHVVNYGGLFVAEDLHCSYWKEYDGGLEDSCSAISFFKLLTDIINHEHWRISNSRLDLLKIIANKYNISFAEEDLKEIHSIEFINSMVVVRKAAIKDNLISSRVIIGEDAKVVQDLKEIVKKEILDIGCQSSVQDGKNISDNNSASSETESQLEELTINPTKNSRKPHIFKRLEQSIRKKIKKIFIKDISTKDLYKDWILKNEINENKNVIAAKIEKLLHQPLISVVMPCYNSKPEFLIEAIESVRNQAYTNWELCISDDASTKNNIQRILKKYVDWDARIKVCFRAKNGHISEASNTALSMVEGEWVTFLDHDDILSQNALLEIAIANNEKPNVRLIYSDEDKIDIHGTRYNPHFKSDWNPDLFFSQNYICHLAAIHKSLIDNVRGFRKGLDGSQDYDILLRCIRYIKDDQIHHIAKILYHWRAVPGSTALNANEKCYATNAGVQSLKDYFKESKTDVFIEKGPNATTYRVKYQIPEPNPLVSLIIPTRDQLNVTRKCITSILNITSYKNFEIIIVDNESIEPETFAYFDYIKTEYKNIKIISYTNEFNYSAVNNFAISFCSGSIIGLINNDIEVISKEWLTEMVSHACRSEIGCVGAKLYYPNGKIQHAGVILGIGGVAGHSHKHFDEKEDGYFCRLKLVQNLSAVTGACLLVRKDIYSKVGGLDERNLQIAFNDVDFCLKVSEAGYRNLWTPYAELSHHESISRGYEDTPEKVARFNSEVNYMIQKWGDKLLNDRYYNINMTLKKEDFSLKS
jgi:glycosyltransferase involved in cell wall biosynthesis